MLCSVEHLNINYQTLYVAWCRTNFRAFSTQTVSGNDSSERGESEPKQVAGHIKSNEMKDN